MKYSAFISTDYTKTYVLFLKLLHGDLNAVLILAFAQERRMFCFSSAASKIFTATLCIKHVIVKGNSVLVDMSIA